MRKAQVISLDLVLAILVFVGIIATFFYVVSLFSFQSQTSNVQRQGEDLPRFLQQNVSSFGFIEDNQIDLQKINSFSNMDYAQLQKALGLSVDFCIYFEDENGNIIPVNNKLGLGSDKVNFGQNQSFQCGIAIS